MVKEVEEVWGRCVMKFVNYLLDLGCSVSSTSTELAQSECCPPVDPVDYLRCGKGVCLFGGV